MESNNNNVIMAVVGVLVVAAIAVGAWLWMSSNDDTDSSNENTTSEVSENTAEQAASKDIVDTAAETASLSTLVSAVQAADLVETLKGEGPYTVFAPTNEAFDKLPDGTLDDLLKPENKEQLSSILTYHVVSGEVMSSDLSDGQVVDTLQGGKLTVEIMDGMVYLVDANDGRAMVTTADVETSNGVVHIIDAVVLPE